jgi:hypothetical protein
MVLVYALLAVPFSAFWFYRFSGWQFTDFPSFYYGAKSALDLLVSPYGAHLTELAGRYVHPFLYPPQSLLFFWPLTALEFAAAGAVLTAISLGLFFVSLAITLHVLVRPAHRNLLGVVACTFVLYASQAFKVNLVLGQINIVVLFAICLSWVLIRKSSFAGAGICLAFAALLKAHPVLLVLPLFILKEYGVLRWFLITTAVATLFAALLLPFDVWSGFLGTALGVGLEGSAGGTIDPVNIQNFSLLGFTKRLFAQSIPLGRLFYYTAAILMVAVASLVVRYAKTRDAIFMTFLPVTVLLSPLAWEHHLVVLAPVFVVFLTAAIAEQRWGQTIVATVAFIICFAYKIPEVFLTNSLLTIAVFSLWAMVCWQELSRPYVKWAIGLHAMQLRVALLRRTDGRLAQH